MIDQSVKKSTNEPTKKSIINQTTNNFQIIIQPIWVPTYCTVGIHDETAEELHPDDGVDEEEDPHQHAHVRQRLRHGQLLGVP